MKKILFAFGPTLFSSLLIAGCANQGTIPELPASQETSVQTPVDQNAVSSVHPNNNKDASNTAYNSCDEVISTENLYLFNPNFSYEPDANPKTGSIGEFAKTSNGVFCSYINLSSGDRIEISVQNSSTSETIFLQDELKKGYLATDTYGTGPNILGYFARNKEIGTALIITPMQLISVSSSIFTSPEDPIKLVALINH